VAELNFLFIMSSPRIVIGDPQIKNIDSLLRRYGMPTRGSLTLIPAFVQRSVLSLSKDRFFTFSSGLVSETNDSYPEVGEELFAISLSKIRSAELSSPAIFRSSTISRALFSSSTCSLINHCNSTVVA
jgi:hypothetical protein